MNKLLVIADDYTGALDTGVQFSKKGVSTLVLTLPQLSGNGIAGVDCDNYEVLVVDTESRHIPVKEAHDTVFKLATDARANGFRHFYKKIDSALRGNIGAELSGLLNAGDGLCLTFVPAYPKSRRVTRNGIHYIDGVEVGQSVFAKDPFSPVLHSSVADIIRTQSDVCIESIRSDSYAKAALQPGEKTLRVLDAESMDDIKALGACLKRSGNLELFAGCAGFAEILPTLLDLPKRDLDWEEKADNILVISGSMNPITAEQLAYGKELGFSFFTFSPEHVLNPEYAGSAECGAFVQDIAGELKRNRRVIVGAVPDVLNRNVSGNGSSRLVADNIGKITGQILASVNVGCLVVFGGDTLYSVLSKMHCTGVIPMAEVATGVVASKILSGRDDCVIITKSGGLGDRDVLGHIEQFILGK